MISVIPVDVEADSILEPVNIRLCPTQTVHDMKMLIAERLRLPSDARPRCVIERYYNTLKPLDLGYKTLHAEGFQKTNKVQDISTMADCWFSFYRIDSITR